MWKRIVYVRTSVCAAKDSVHECVCNNYIPHDVGTQSTLLNKDEIAHTLYYPKKIKLPYKEYMWTDTTKRRKTDTTGLRGKINSMIRVTVTGATGISSCDWELKGNVYIQEHVGT
jgi:hypothetical protein